MFAAILLPLLTGVLLVSAQTCTPVCSNGGTCIAMNVCSCATGWSGTGTGCTTPICTGANACQHGTCTAPNVCTCYAGWVQANCTQPICSFTCFYGTCAAPDFCSCSIGWAGTQCTIPICSGGCQHGGTCTSPENCQCTIDWGEYNTYCQYPNCRTNSTVSGSASGYIRSGYWPSNYHSNDNCGWFLEVPGDVIQMDINVVQLENGVDFLYIYDGWLSSDPLLITLTWNNQRITLITTTNRAFIRFTSNPTIAGQGFEIYYKQVVVDPVYTYLNGGSLTYWNVSASAVVQGNGALRLVPNSPSQNGAMWAVTPLNMTDFALKAEVIIGNTGTSTEGLGVFFVPGDSIANSMEYGIDWTNYQGLSIFATPKQASIFASYSPIIANDTSSRFTCSSPNNTRINTTSCGAHTNLRQTFTLTVAVTRGLTLRVTLCTATATPRCVAPIQYYAGLTPYLFTLPSPLYFGITAWNSASNYDTVDIYDAKFYKPPFSCVDDCTWNGNCIANNNCSCDAGWTGATCAIPICSPNCLNGGTCILPDVCVCVRGFTGPICASAYCITTTSVNVTTINGTFSSDGYATSANYYNDEECGWSLQTETPGYAIEVFLRTKTIDRNGDYIEVYDGIDSSSQLIFHSSASYYAARFISSSNSIFIFFYSNLNNATGLGFTFSYAAVSPPLSGRVSGSLQPLNYPGSKYYNNEDEEWQFSLSNGQYFWLELYTATFDGGLDGLSLYDGTNTSNSSLIVATTSNNFQQYYATYNSTFYAHFTTDANSVMGTGFLLNFRQALPRNPCPLTGTVISGQSTGTIQTPNYGAGNFYNPNETCSWKITVSSGNVLSLDLFFGRMGNDTLRIYDGPDETALMVMESSSGFYQATLKTSTNVVYIKFLSNSDNVVGEGFVITFNETLSTTPGRISGVVQSYNYSSGSNEVQSWLVNVPVGSLIWLTLNNCTVLGVNDTLTLYDGASSASPVIRQVLPAQIVNKFYQTSNSSVFWQSSNAGNNAHLTFQQTDLTGCSATGTTEITNNRTGQIQSDNYGYTYYTFGKNCSWLITAPVGYAIWLDLTVSVPATSWLKIYDGSNSTIDGLICALTGIYDYKAVFVTTANQAFIHFITLPYEVDIGFKVAFRQVTYVPHFSYGNDTANYSADWDVTVTHNGTIRQADSSIRLVPASPNQNGAMLSLVPFDVSEFVLSAVVTIGSTGTNGWGVGVFFTSNTTAIIPAVPSGGSYCLNWNVFKGLAVLGQPAVESIYAVYSATPASKDISICNTPGYFYGSCSAHTSLRTTFTLIVAVTGGEKISVTYCSSANNTNCQSVFSDATLSPSLATLISGTSVLYGYGGHGSAFFYDSVDIKQVRFYATTTDCSPACTANNGVCIASTCHCRFGWTDSTCSTPICRSPCSNCAICVAPDTCQCAPNFAGPTCDLILCNSNMTVNINSTSTTGNITSDYYPGNYLDGVRCGWQFNSLVAGYTVELTIEAGTMDETGDSLSIYDASNEQLVLRTSSDYYQLGLTMNTSSYFVYFQSDLNNITGTGFKIGYRMVPIPAKASGYLQTPYAASATYFSNQNDAWLIRLPSFMWLNFHTGTFGNSATDMLKVYDGSDNSSTVIFDQNINNCTTIYTTTSGTMFARFQSGASTSGSGYQLRFQEAENSASCQQCTLITNSTSGYVTSENYLIDGPYSHNDNCTWLITMPTGYTVWLELSVGLIESGQDFVAIYDGSSTADTILVSTSKSNYSSSFMTTSNKAFIRFTSNGPYQSGTGFSLFYRRAYPAPNLSFENSIADNFEVYLPYAGSIVQANGAIRLVPDQTTQNGAMWAKIPINMTDFFVNIAVSIGTAGLGSSGVGVFFTSNSSVPRPSTTNNFGVFLNNFLGLAAFASPATAIGSIFASFSEVISTDTTRSSCSYADNFPTTCNTSPLQQSFILGISLTNGNVLSVTACLNSTGCSSALLKANLNTSLTSLGQFLMFGIGASNQGSYSDYVDVREVKFYTTITCSQPCQNNATCIGQDQCYCTTDWKGTLCDTPICSPDCLNGATCSAPFTCTCTTGWTDSICQTPVCSPECQNGNCTGPNVCTCEAGWTDPICNSAICEPQCNAMGGNCTEPDVCTCNLGWNGTFCEQAICNATCQNGGTCSQPDTCSCDATSWTGPTCLIPVCNPPCLHGNCSEPNTCVCEDHWNGSAGCDQAICDMPCYNNASCSSPNTCTCVVGFSGPQCEISTGTFTPIDLAKMTDSAILANLPAITNVVQGMTSAVAKDGSPEAVTDMLSTLDNLLNRFGNITDMDPDTFTNIAAICSSAADAMMTSATAKANNGTSDDDFAFDEDTMKCQVGDDGKISAFVSDKPPPSPDTKEKLRKMFNAFMTMIVNMFANLRAILRPGTNMTFTGEFYGATVFNVRLGNLSGLVLDTSLAKAIFPTVDDPLSLLGTIPTQCSSPLTDNSIVPAVLSAFIINVMDVDKPFNMPTVAVRLYCPEKAELPLAIGLSMKVVAKPSIKKAALFASQKKDAQCDISKVACDLSQNADAIGSLAIFPLTLSGGDFVLIIPVIKFNYSAYVYLNSTPAATRYHWQFNVTYNEVVMIQNNTYDPVRYHYNTAADLRVIIPGSAIGQFAKSNDVVSLYVYTKRDFSQFASLSNLPSEACDLQRTYGYHLRIGLAKEESKRRRRAVDSAGFQLEPESTESAVVFTSQYFGDFGADLAISPNTIEFSDIFANFASLVANNAGVLAFQCSAVFFFLVAVVFAWRFDKDDLKQWAFLPIISNTRYQKVRYLISVQFNKVRNFDLKTSPFISIRLDGTIHDTNWRLLDDGVRKSIWNGKHPANFCLTTQLRLGRIDAIDLKVEQQNVTPNSKRYHLHIDRVIIVDPDEGAKYVYLVKSTMQAGSVKRTELPTEDEMKSYKYLITGQTRTSFTDIHPWLSIAQRPRPSNWTRVERLGCVVSALFMAMLVNAMFYGQEAKAPSVGIKVGGFFTISWFTVWTSFVGCVIVIPPTGIMAFIFKKIKRRTAEKSEWETIFNIKINETKHVSPNNKADQAKPQEKKPFQLPFYCVIIAWFLVAACVGCSSFFIVMYSLSWGQEKSLQWLSGMVLSVFQDILLIQPIKVVVSAIASATVHNLPGDGLEKGKLTYNPNNNRHKVELFNKARNIMVGIFHHAIYVVICAAVIGSTMNPFAYLQINVLKPIVSVQGTDPYSGTIADPSTIYYWLNYYLLPSFLSGNQLAKRVGIFKTADALYQVPNPQVVLLGPIRLRQQRVSPTECIINKAISGDYTNRFVPTLGSTCQKWYSDSLGMGDSSEQRFFNGSWNTMTSEIDHDHMENLTFFEQPWIYRECDGTPYAGWEATYRTGGYYVDLPKSLVNARTIVNYLSATRWLDNATTTLLIDFTLFNMQTNLFIPVKVAFEALSAGGMSYHLRMFPLQLYQYSGASSMVVFIVQALWILLLLSHLIRIILSMKKAGCRQYFSNGWNVLDSVQITLGLAIVGLFAARIYVIMNFIEKVHTMHNSLVSLDLLANWEDIMFCLFGIQFFMAMFGFFRHLSINKHWAILLATLSKGKLDIASYGFIFAAATILFAGIAYLVMGHDYWDFSSYTRSIMAFIQSIIGTLNFTAIHTRLYLLLCMMYTAVVVFLGTNMFVTLIMAAYGDVVLDVEKTTNWDAELSDFLATGIKELILPKKLVEKTTEDETKEFEPIGKGNCAEFERLVDRFEKYVERQITDFAGKSAVKTDRCQLAWAVDQKVRKAANEKLKEQLRRMLPFAKPIMTKHVKNLPPKLVAGDRHNAMKKPYDTSVKATVRSLYLTGNHNDQKNCNKNLQHFEPYNKFD